MPFRNDRSKECTFVYQTKQPKPRRQRRSFGEHVLTGCPKSWADEHRALHARRIGDRPRKRGSLEGWSAWVMWRGVDSATHGYCNIESVSILRWHSADSATADRGQTPRKAQFQPLLLVACPSCSSVYAGNSHFGDRPRKCVGLEGVGA